jgi:hypothetical protein
MSLKPKVFCIGFHKTGTKSLAKALSMLGYRVTGPNEVRNVSIRQQVLEIAPLLVARFDAFQDNPWPILYRELDEWYPRSKFILTLRPTNEWIASVVSHFGGAETPMREWIYGFGDPRGHEMRYVEIYERHNREVLRYFQDRPGDLLVLRIAAGDGWQKLCAFLGANEPIGRFPSLNRAAHRRTPTGGRS